MSESLWLHDFLDYWALVGPGEEFAIHEDRIVTYGAAAQQVERYAGTLAAALDPGDRIAMLSKNSIEMILFYYAASKAGVVPVPLNYRLAPPEWEYILGDAGARLIFAQTEFCAAIDDIRASTALTTFVSSERTAGHGWIPLDDWVGEPLRLDDQSRRRHDEAFQMYTSGTTGLPKGAVVTQGALGSTVHQWRICYPFSGEERLLIVAPIYHVGGMLNVFHAIAHGGAVYLMTDFDARGVVRALDEERIEMAFLVPSMIQACLNDEEGIKGRSFESLRLISYGGSPIAEPVLRRALEIFNCDFVQGFGMTECNCLTYLSPADHRRALEGAPHLLESTGRVGPGSSIRIVDDDDREVPAYTVGEICGRGPQTMRGYWNLPDATADALRAGWMHTGDAGYVDDEGYLYVKDRVKDMIVSGGENVYPREIENVLFRHPDVADVAVIGVPDTKWGETVKAVVVLVRGSIVTAEDLIEFCRDKMAGFKRPRSIDFVADLPRNPSGKVLKRVLREPYWEGHQRRVG